MEEDRRTCVCGMHPLGQYGARCPSCPKATWDGCLMPPEWKALGEAEEVIYAGDRGVHPLTSVMAPGDAPILGTMWEWTEFYIVDTTEPNTSIQAETARRIAAAMKMLSFGYC